jgi:hypothetical protein
VESADTGVLGIAVAAIGLLLKAVIDLARSRGEDSAHHQLTERLIAMDGKLGQLVRAKENSQLLNAINDQKDGGN